MSLQGLSSRLARLLAVVASRSHRHPGRTLLLLSLVTGLGLWGARGLSLDADLVALLPQSFRSVQDIHALEERFGGIGWVVVVGEGAPPETLRRFADDVAPRLAALPSVRFVEHRRPGAFFRDRALYFLDTADLEIVKARLKAREKWERRRRNPMYVQLEETPPPPIDMADIEARYAGRSDQRLAGGDEPYYLDAADRRIVILAKPAGHSADLGFAQRVVGEVEGLLSKSDLRPYGPDFRVAVTGTFKKKLDQQTQIGRDVASASTLALVGVLAYLALHFRSGLAVLLTLLPVGAGLAWVYGLVGVTYGRVHLLTGFLGAILGGLGVEHGIHLLGRYVTLRGEGRTASEAVTETFAHTGSAAVVSALVASLTFFSLALSDFHAFREFGVIAGVGMLLLVAAYVAILPATLGTAERLGWQPRGARQVAGRGSLVARWLPRLRWPLAVGTLLLLALPAIEGRNLTFDYDFAALEDHRLPSYVLDKQVNRLLGYSQTPVVVLTDSPEDERAAIRELQARKAALGQHSTVDFVAALDDLIPPDQARKRELLEGIAGVLARVDPEGLDPQTRSRYLTLREQAAALPFTRADLPDEVRRQFQGRDGANAGFVLVFPAISLADGAKVRDFAKEVREIQLPSGKRLSAAGDAMVLADILEMITAEGPVILAVSLLSVLLATWLTLGRLGTALLCLSPTLVSLLILTGLMPLAGLPFNYLNILVVPVLVGVTVDAGVHLLTRLSEPHGSFTIVYSETARAISGGLLTSAVGFGALLLADHPGLNSLGQLANLGFATNLLVTVVGFPALLLVLVRQRSPSVLP